MKPNRYLREELNKLETTYHLDTLSIAYIIEKTCNAIAQHLHEQEPTMEPIAEAFKVVAKNANLIVEENPRRS